MCWDEGFNGNTFLSYSFHRQSAKNLLFPFNYTANIVIYPSRHVTIPFLFFIFTTQTFVFTKQTFALFSNAENDFAGRASFEI